MLRDPPYQWVIEGDIEGCFDNLGHHHLMDRVRKSCADRKANRLIVRFIKAGVLEDFIYHPTATGTPQGGVVAPHPINLPSHDLRAVRPHASLAHRNSRDSPSNAARILRGYHGTYHQMSPKHLQR